MKYRKGNKVKLTPDAIDNYGSEYRDRIFTISSASNKYMPAKDFFASGRPAGYHPGYDEGVSPMGLYDLIGLEFSLYDWEIMPA